MKKKNIKDLLIFHFKKFKEYERIPSNYKMPLIRLFPKINKIEEIIFKDPGNRGISKLYQPNNLYLSSLEILKTPRTKKSYILTGFCCIFPSCETDGPLGSSILNSTLNYLGFDNYLLTDSYSEKVIKASSKTDKIIIENSYEKFLEKNIEKDISFIISVERPGRTLKTKDYRTMKGKNINNQNCNLDLLFPGENEKKNYLTIGIGDGGNECGTGNIYKEIQKYIYLGNDICTDRFCDYLIMSGVSNWGALGLCSSLIILNNDYHSKKFFIDECYSQKKLLEKIISAGSYDGVTGKAELSVDGMMFDKEHSDIIEKIVNVVKETM